MALSSSLNDVCFLLCCFLADRLHFNLHLFPTFEDDDDCLCPMPHSPIYLKIDLLLNMGCASFMTDDHRDTVDSNRLIVSYKIVLAKSRRATMIRIIIMI